MDFIIDQFQFDLTSWQEIILRIVLAIFFGFMIGLDRGAKDKPVDFRVYMLVGLTTCVVAIMSQELYASYEDSSGILSLDLGKVIAGTLTGIGFLGAGAIIKQEDDKNVVGTATGASIWASGGMGLALGFGYYGLAFIAFIGVMVVLTLFGGFRRAVPFLEKNEEPSDS